MLNGDVKFYCMTRMELSSNISSTASSLATTSNVLYVTDDLDPESSPCNTFPKSPLGVPGLINVQGLHMLATANLIAQTQESIAQQYNITVDPNAEKQLINESRSPKRVFKSRSSSPELKVKRTVPQSKLAKKAKRFCAEQFNQDGSITAESSKQGLETPAEHFCTHCTEKFKTKAELKSHYKLHKPMECHHAGCNRKFTWPTHYKYHQLTHTGEKKFICEFEGCGHVFLTSQHLEVHQRIHNNSRPFSCSDCQKSFTTAGNLKNHRRCHTGEKPFVCDNPDCDKKFAELSTLKKHKITHTGKKPFKCEICHRTFTQSSSRRVHMKTHHGGEPDKRKMNTEVMAEATLSESSKDGTEKFSNALVEDTTTVPSPSIVIVVVPPDHDNG